MKEILYVLNDDPKNQLIHYHDNGDPTKRLELEDQWKHFNHVDPATGETYKLLVRPTNPNLEVSVDYSLPKGITPGRYSIETFVPARNATTTKAIFSIIHTLQNESGKLELDEAVSLVDMDALRDVWKSLGEFYLDPGMHAKVGRVRQYDLSLEDPPEVVCFGPIRWVPMITLSAGDLHYDPPVGADLERIGGFPTFRYIFGKYPVWTGEWFDYNPFLNWYIYGHHTGADLNLPGGSAADKGKPIYSISDGVVTYAGKAGSWGNIIVIEHPQAYVTYPDGHIEQQVVYSRYGHVEDQILVKVGNAVKKGQKIGFIGLAAGADAGWHLHFDISHTDILKKRPSYWPSLTAIRRLRGPSKRDSLAFRNAQAANMREVMEHFIDPFRFLQNNHI